ncbi:hypothetical protein [Mesorhizobium sp. M0965]|uniref:hypothetical protein n=1 Tax=unclassified Mesorhizobium TaxID=325217 RepID=UPI0033350E53
MALNIARTSEHDAPNDERLPTIGLAQDITLTSQDGARVSLRDFRGDQRRRMVAATSLQIFVVSGGLLFRGSSRFHQQQPHGNKCRKRVMSSVRSNVRFWVTALGCSTADIGRNRDFQCSHVRLT